MWMMTWWSNAEFYLMLAMHNCKKARLFQVGISIENVALVAGALYRRSIIP
jgi:hypothetical protein